MHAVILGITAEIGHALASRLLADGWAVTGLGRDLDRARDLDAALVGCDVADPQSVREAARQIGPWDLFISSVGTMQPIGRFFDLDFEDWERSVIVNSTAQLRVLHEIWDRRSPEANIMFMAGGGTNNPFRNYSAYCAAKILLIKMVELIDDEEPAANTFIVGPGFTRTRIHHETLAAGEAAGEGLERTRAFLESGGGTSMDDIYDHMRWCMAHPRAASGRNFSTVHDPWRTGDAFADAIGDDPDAFRLRRAGVSS